ncbi:MAG: GTP-binding protein [Phototrophicaceae bacterium]
MKKSTLPKHFPVPITILTGFLGAGKTTLLNHILHSEHGMKIAVLVNDFGAINVDAQLIVGVEGEMVTLSNGCICCTIRGDLMNETLRLLQLDDPPEYILIEASGVSDPMAIAVTFRVPEFMPMVKLDGVITVVDAEQFFELENENEWLSLAQVGFADIVVLSKVDLVTDTYREIVKTRIRKISPFARIIEAVQGQVAPELLLGSGEFSPEKLVQREAHDVHVHAVDEVHDHHHEHNHALVYSTWSWISSVPLERNCLQDILISLPTTVYRSKGIIYLVDEPDYRFVFQLVGKRADLVRHRLWQADEVRQTQLVIISSHDGIDGEELTRKFENCVTE